MSATGRSDVRDPDDHYVTPGWVVDAIMPHLDVLGHVVDAGAGTGAISRRVLDFNKNVDIIGVETNAERAAEYQRNVGRKCVNESFLTWDDGEDTSLTIMNPPFKYAMEFIEHALLCREAGQPDQRRQGQVAALLRIGFLATVKRAEFHRMYPCDLYVLKRRPSFTGQGTDSSEYAWFVWRAGGGGRWFLV